MFSLNISYFACYSGYGVANGSGCTPCDVAIADETTACYHSDFIIPASSNLNRCNPNLSNKVFGLAFEKPIEKALLLELICKHHSHVSVGLDKTSIITRTGK